jgi:hypothetical protein
LKLEECAKSNRALRRHSRRLVISMIPSIPAVKLPRGRCLAIDLMIIETEIGWWWYQDISNAHEGVM